MAVAETKSIPELARLLTLHRRDGDDETFERLAQLQIQQYLRHANTEMLNATSRIQTHYEKISPWIHRWSSTPDPGHNDLGNESQHVAGRGSALRHPPSRGGAVDWAEYFGPPSHPTRERTFGSGGGGGDGGPTSFTGRWGDAWSSPPAPSSVIGEPEPFVMGPPPAPLVATPAHYPAPPPPPPAVIPGAVYSTPTKSRRAAREHRMRKHHLGTMAPTAWRGGYRDPSPPPPANRLPS